MRGCVAIVGAVVDIWSSFAWLLPDPEHSPGARAGLVLGYVIAGICWLRASRRTRTKDAPSLKVWWVIGAALLFLLAANKMLDLRDHCAAAFRALAKAGHWYDRRQAAQFILAIVLPIVAVVGIGAYVSFRARGFVARHPLALAGWLLLFLYLVLRQSQEWKPMLDCLDALRYRDWRLGLEVAGILLVILAALLGRPLQPAGSPPTAA